MSLPLFLLAVMAISAPVTAPAAGDPLQQLDAFRQLSQPLSMEFEQQQLDDSGRAVERQRGRLEILPPDRFAWKYTDPYRAEFGSNGILVWHWDPDLAQITVRDARRVVSETPLGMLLSGTSPWPVQPEADGWLRWEPQGEESLFTALRVQMRDAMPVQIELQDALGQTTRVILGGVRLPDAAVDPRFPAVGPETTIVDQRGAP